MSSGDPCRTPCADAVTRGRPALLLTPVAGAGRYLDRVFGMRCFEDIVRLQVFPDAKDITESYGALQAAARLGGIVGPAGTQLDSRQAERRRGVLCINIGDGSTPRTAVLAAYLTSWTAVSIDPAMRECWRGTHPRGVAGVSSFGLTLEDWAADPELLAQVGEACAASARERVGPESEPEPEPPPPGPGPEPEPELEPEPERASEEAAEAEAKASIAFIKASPERRSAWLTWLAAQPSLPVQANDPALHTAVRQTPKPLWAPS